MAENNVQDEVIKEERIYTYRAFGCYRHYIYSRGYPVPSVCASARKRAAFQLHEQSQANWLGDDDVRPGL